MEYIHEGASIECANAEIISRKIVQSAYQNLPNVGRCIKYVCKQNSEATILKELNPKKFLVSSDAHLNLGDSIAGANINVWVNQNRLLKLTVINYTSSHKAQKTETGVITIAKISKLFQHALTPKDPKQLAELKKRQLPSKK